MSKGKAMRPLRALLISDDYPGHANFAYGVLAAIERLRPVETHTRSVRVRFAYRMQAVRPLVSGGRAALKAALALGYGIAAKSLPDADLVISGGGNTLAANVAAARLLGAPNIFCGSLRGGMSPSQFALLVTSYEDLYEADNVVVTVKPSIYSPESFDRPPHDVRYGKDNPPKRAGLLVGGSTGKIKYRDDEWERLIGFISEVHEAWGTRWLISTARKTPDHVADAFAELAKNTKLVELFVDYRTAGPGTLRPIFSDSEIIVGMPDSSAMLSEAISVHLPVVVLTPDALDYKPEEAAYQQMFAAKNWCRFIPIRNLSMAALAAALAEIQPPEVNHLDLLARELEKRLPILFE